MPGTYSLQLPFSFSNLLDLSWPYSVYAAAEARAVTFNYYGHYQNGSSFPCYGLFSHYIATSLGKYLKIFT